MGDWTDEFSGHADLYQDRLFALKLLTSQGRWRGANGEIYDCKTVKLRHLLNAISFFKNRVQTLEEEEEVELSSNLKKLVAKLEVELEERRKDYFFAKGYFESKKDDDNNT